MKKLLVLAVITALSIPAAFADTANMNFYGTINTALESAKAGDSTAGAGVAEKLRMKSYSSNFGFKGSDEISDGLKGIFQVEFNLDTVAGSINAGSFRNTGLGFDTNFGKVIFGRWDNPFKTAAAFADPFYGGVGYMKAVWDSAMSDRNSSSLNYWSPSFMGANIQWYLVPATANKNYKMGGSLNYAQGPITAAFAYDLNKHMTATQNLKGYKAAAGYKLFDTTGLNVGWVSYALDNPDQDEVDLKLSALLFSVTHQMGDWKLKGAYGMQGKASVLGAEQDETAAAQMSFGADYSLSKRTTLYGVFTKLTNEEAADNNFDTAPVEKAGGGSVAGADPQVIAFGVKHSF